MQVRDISTQKLDVLASKSGYKVKEVAMKIMTGNRAKVRCNSIGFEPQKDGKGPHQNVT